jgi:hypothetical protein
VDGEDTWLLYHLSNDITCLAGECEESFFLVGDRRRNLCERSKWMNMDGLWRPVVLGIGREARCQESAGKHIELIPAAMDHLTWINQPWTRPH